MHDSCAVVGGHEISAQHLERVRRVGEVREGREIAQTEQLLPGVAAQDPRVVAEFARVGRQPRASDHEPPALVCDDDVLDVGVDRHGLVGRQRPRRRRPDQQVGTVEIGAGCHDRQPDGDRGVLTALVDVVVHPQFVTGQRCLVVPAVRQDPHTLIRQAPIPQLLEDPYHRLHERQVKGLVVVVEVDPPGLPGDVGAPFAGVAQHRVAAGVVEYPDTHLLDLGLVGDVELTLDLEFGRQAMGVPAEPALHLVAAHRPVARDDVLDISGQQVAVVR